MDKNIIKSTTHSVFSAYDRFKHDNPLMIRKKFEMKDVMFRHDQPDVEVFRTEIAFDVQLYFILIALLCTAVCIFLKITHYLEKKHLQSLQKRCHKSKKA